MTNTGFHWQFTGHVGLGDGVNLAGLPCGKAYRQQAASAFLQRAARARSPIYHRSVTDQCMAGQMVHTATLPSSEVVNFHVDPRFHSTLVGWNQGSTREFPTWFQISSYVSWVESGINRGISNLYISLKIRNWRVLKYWHQNYPIRSWSFISQARGLASMSQIPF